MSKLATFVVALAALVLALSPFPRVPRKPDGAAAAGGWGGPGVNVYVGPRWGWYAPRYRYWGPYASGYPYAYYPYWRGRYYRGWY